MTATEHPKALRVLFVHGMGRTSASGWPMLWRLRRAGLMTAVFGYTVSRENFSQITERLAATISNMLAHPDEEVVLVGHSLGGVLLRAALQKLGLQARPPHHLFLLGSPLQTSRLAQRLGQNWLFRACARDCGALLGSPSRMAAIAPAASLQTTGISGISGIRGRRSPFGNELNDGVVALSEVSADWLIDQELVPVLHTLLPSSRRVGSIILARLGA